MIKYILKATVWVKSWKLVRRIFPEGNRLGEIPEAGPKEIQKQIYPEGNRLGRNPGSWSKGKKNSKPKTNKQHNTYTNQND
jgi:hypothetical protein